MRHEGIRSEGYVRIPTSALSGVQLRHLVSEKDSSIAVPGGIPAGTVITGITEWVGSWRTETVSVGWDWGVVDGLVVLLSQKEIRTNIQLVSQDQGPVSAAIAQIHLFHWIESLPWRELAVDELLRRP
jgi:hypothetical protein